MTIVDGVRMMDFNAMNEAQCLIAYHGSLDYAIAVCERFSGCQQARTAEDVRRHSETLRALYTLRERGSK